MERERCQEERLASLRERAEAQRARDAEFAGGGSNVERRQPRFLPQGPPRGDQ